MDGGARASTDVWPGSWRRTFNRSRPPSHVRVFLLSSRLCFGPEVPCSFRRVTRLPTRRRVELLVPGPATLAVAEFSFCFLGFVKCRFAPCGPVGLNCSERGGVKGETLLMKCRLLRISGRVLRVPLVRRLPPCGGLADGAPPRRCGCRVLPRQRGLDPASACDPRAPPGFTVIEV